MTDLRTLAQAVVDASGRGTVGPADYAAKRAFCAAANCAYDDAESMAGWLLAALDAERAQGYARAMGEVVERADHSADYTGWSDYALGHRDAHERLAVWARERLPAAAEKEHGG